MRANHGFWASGVRIKTKCSAHTEVNAVTTCVQCGEGLCMNCHNDNNPGFCYHCSGRPAVMKRVEEPSAQVTREKRIKRVVIIIFLVFLTIAGVIVGGVIGLVWMLRKNLGMI